MAKSLFIKMPSPLCGGSIPLSDHEDFTAFLMNILDFLDSKRFLLISSVFLSSSNDLLFSLSISIDMVDSELMLRFHKCYSSLNLDENTPLNSASTSCILLLISNLMINFK